MHSPSQNCSPRRHTTGWRPGVIATRAAGRRRRCLRCTCQGRRRPNVLCSARPSRSSCVGGGVLGDQKHVAVRRCGRYSRDHHWPFARRRRTKPARPRCLPQSRLSLVHRLRGTSRVALGESGYAGHPAYACPIQPVSLCPLLHAKTLLIVAPEDEMVHANPTTSHDVHSIPCRPRSNSGTSRMATSVTSTTRASASMKLLPHKSGS
jgi:hypothetical protein